MKIARDVGVIESVEVAVPLWVQLIFDGDNDGAVELFSKEYDTTRAWARKVINGFEREVIHARKVSDG